MPDEPGGWELKRGMDQLRADLRDDVADLKGDVAGVAARLDAMDARYVSHREHSNLATRVEKLEGAGEKRTDRNITIWLGIGVAAFSSLTSTALSIFAFVTR